MYNTYRKGNEEINISVRTLYNVHIFPLFVRRSAYTRIVIKKKGNRSIPLFWNSYRRGRLSAPTTPQLSTKVGFRVI